MPIILSPDPAGVGVTLTVDSTVVDAANTAFVINDNVTRFLLKDGDYPMPEPQVIYAQPVDADGDTPAHTRYGNRQGCTVTFAIQGTSAINLETTLGQWSQKLAKLNRDGGTLLRATPAGTSYYLPVFPGTTGANFDRRYVKNNRAEVVWTFPAGPHWIATAGVQQADTVETTLPYVSRTAAGPAGDACRGQLMVDDDQGADQWWVVWGIEDNSQYDIAAASAWLFGQAESLTAMGGSAIAAGPSGASGAGSNVMRNTALSTDYLALLSTQATGGGAHLSHVGQFMVYARVQAPTSNAGTVSVALEWAAGDFRKSSRNSPVALSPDWEGTWRLPYLGIVTIPKVLSGTQRWEGRVIAKSTGSNDDLDIDYLLLIPTSAGSGTASGVLQVPAVTSFTARDDFDQAAGAVTGKTLPAGGTWVGAGDADDFAMNTTSKTADRTAVSDADVNTGRYLIAGTTVLTNVQQQADSQATAGGARQGLLARYTDTSNWFSAMYAIADVGTSATYEIRKRVAGTTTIIKSAAAPFAGLSTWVTTRLVIDASGRWAFWIQTAGLPFAAPIATGQDPVLATGGALASGKSGLYDVMTGAAASTRSYDNFGLAVFVPDAAMYASQSLEIRHNGVIREDSAGAIWQDVSNFQGDLLGVPVAGREGRSVRWIVKTCRNDPATGPDSAIDDTSARLTQTSLYLTVPSP